MPDAVVGQDVGDLADELQRLLQIVEHRDRRDDPRLPSAQRGPVEVRREEIRDQAAVGRIAAAPAGGRRIEAEEAEVLTRRSEEHTSELQSQSNLVCRLLLEKKK